MFPDGFFVLWPIKLKTEAHIISRYLGAFIMLILSPNDTGPWNTLGL